MSVSRWRFSRLGMLQVVSQGQNSQSVCKVDDIPENLKDYKNINDCTSLYFLRGMSEKGGTQAGESNNAVI